MYGKCHHRTKLITLKIEVMKEITKKKTKHLLYTLLAVVLFVASCFFVWMSIPEIEKIVNDKYAPITAFGCIFYVALVTVAVFKHYR